MYSYESVAGSTVQILVQILNNVEIMEAVLFILPFKNAHSMVKQAQTDYT